MSRSVDVIIVSFNSAPHIRGCVESLNFDDVGVTIVDNASTDRTLEAVADLPVKVIALEENVGFARASNLGWKHGDAPYVLLLNPDATLSDTSLHELRRRLEETPSAGAVGPKILERDGRLSFSQRRFQRLSSTYAQALFLHRFFPRSSWASEVVTNRSAYERVSSPDWVSGAVLLVRRSVLERLGGLDEGFFLYSEDEDLCRRIRGSGYQVLFEPRAVAIHEGGASAPRSSLLPVLAESRARYATKHSSVPIAVLERGGLALEALSHIAVCKGGLSVRAGHAGALKRLVRGTRRSPSVLTERTQGVHHS